MQGVVKAGPTGPPLHFPPPRFCSSTRTHKFHPRSQEAAPLDYSLSLKMYIPVGVPGEENHKDLGDMVKAIQVGNSRLPLDED